MKKHCLFFLSIMLLLFSQSDIANAAPGVPQVQGLGFTARTNTTIYSVWTPVPGATQYIHEYSEDGVSNWQVTTFSATAGPEFIMRGLTPNVTYHVRVKAVIGGSEGSYSTIALMRTLNVPNAPTNLRATLQSGVANLTWEDNSNAETRYLVYASFNGGGSYAAPISVPAVNGGLGRFSYGGLPPNSDVFFYVVAENLDGISAQSNNLRVTTVPNKVSLISTYAVGLNFVGLFWQGPNTSPGGFNLQYMRENSGSWNTIFISSNAGNSFVVPDLQQGTRYFFRIAALNSSGQGDFSDPILVTTLRRTAPNAPKDLRTRPLSDVSIISSWALGTEDQVFFTNTRNSLVAQITRDTTMSPSSFPVNRDEASFTFVDLQPRTAYFIRVGAVNEIGTNFTPWKVDTTLGRPIAPSNVAASAARDATGGAIVNISWKDNSTNEEFFTVTVQGGSAPQSVKVIPNTTRFTHVPVEEGVSYAYFVSAGNQFGTSTNSDTIRVTVPFTTTPKAPYGLKAVRSGGNVVLTWLDDSNAEQNFSIERAPAGTTTFAVVGTVNRNVTTFTDVNVAGNAGFVYRVRATNPIGSSAYSNTASVTGATGQGLVPADWAIYPNPTANSLRVDVADLDLKGALTVRVLDGMNRELLRKSFDAATGTVLDMSSLKEGTYTLVVSGDGTKISKKVVKL